jgi:hypothetical protein
VTAALQFEFVRFEHEDRRLPRVLEFAQGVRNRLHPSSPRVPLLLAAAVRACEHAPGSLEELARLAIAAVPSVDPAHRDGFAARAEDIKALFRKGAR